MISSNYEKANQFYKNLAFSTELLCIASAGMCAFAFADLSSICDFTGKPFCIFFAEWTRVTFIRRSEAVRLSLLPIWPAKARTPMAGESQKFENQSPALE